MTAFAATTPETTFSDEDRARAIELWTAALGEDAVLLGADAAEFRDPYTTPEFGFTVDVVLQPTTVEEVQEVLRIANETGVPVWANSQGRNNGYGGSAPRVPGTVLLNLRRMKRVIEINDELGYVVVEPGVSFRELYDAVRASGKRIMVDVPDLSWGSVVGNALDHGNGYTEYGDHAASLCGLEVVLPTGEIVRTGMGALPDSPNFHLSRRGFGPQLDGLFTQSNYGVVVSAGMWMMPTPDAYAFVTLAGELESDLEPLVDGLRPFLVDGTVRSCPSLFNAIGALATQVTRPQIWDGPAPVPADLLKEVAASVGLKAWNAGFGIYGDAQIVARNIERITEAFADHPTIEVNARVIGQDELYPDNPGLNQKEKVHGGVPDLSMISILDWEGGTRGGHLSFAATVPLTGRDVRRIVDMSRARLAEDDFDYFVGICMYQRFAIHISLMLYDLDQTEQVEKTYAAYADLVRKAAGLGYGEYRAHLTFMDLVAEQYDFNDSALLHLAETIKDAVDPRGILAPGKQGIWPAHLRG